MLLKYRENGTRSLVLDPLCDPDWKIEPGKDFQTDDAEEFLRVVRASRSFAIFVDESGASIGRYAGPMATLATQARHFGHKSHFLTQRAAQLDRTVRDQCSGLFLFRVGKEDAKTMAEEFGYEELKNANNLAQGECYRVTRFSAPVKMKIF